MNEDRLDTPRNQLAAWLANRALRIATPRYRKFMRGAMEYGLRAAARDQREGNDPPEDWRYGNESPFPRIEGDQP